MPCASCGSSANALSLLGVEIMCAGPPLLANMPRARTATSATTTTTMPPMARYMGRRRRVRRAAARRERLGASAVRGSVHVGRGPRWRVTQRRRCYRYAAQAVGRWRGCGTTRLAPRLARHDLPCPHDLLWQRGPPCRDQRACAGAVSGSRSRIVLRQLKVALGCSTNRCGCRTLRGRSLSRRGSKSTARPKVVGLSALSVVRSLAGVQRCRRRGCWSAARAEPRSGVLHPGLDAQRRATSTAPARPSWSAATRLCLRRLRPCRAGLPGSGVVCPGPSPGRTNRRAARPEIDLPALAERDWASRDSGRSTATTGAVTSARGSRPGWVAGRRYPACRGGVGRITKRLVQAIGGPAR